MRTGKDYQLRERLLENAAQYLADVELMAILLSSGSSQRKVGEIAQEVLALLDQRLDVNVEQLLKIKGIGLAKASAVMAALEFCRRRYKPLNHKITNAEDAFLCISHLADRQENVVTLTLNGAGELLNTRIITRGLLDRSLVHPREIFIGAIRDCAASLIMAHNHPSANLMPSVEDLQVTKSIAAVGRLVGIELFDHIIFSSKGYFSLQEQGYSFVFKEESSFNSLQ